MGRRPLDIEKIAMELIMSDDEATRKKLSKKIFDIAYKKGIYPSSIHDFYMARGRGEFTGFTVPAINLRSMTYDLAKAIFRVAKKNNSGAFIFEGEETFPTVDQADIRGLVTAFRTFRLGAASV